MTKTHFFQSLRCVRGHVADKSILSFYDETFKNAQIIHEFHLKMIEYNNNICCNE